MKRLIFVGSALAFTWADAEPEDKYALGLTVPDMDKVSVWRSSGSSAWGLEIGGLISSSQGEVSQVTTGPEGEWVKEEIGDLEAGRVSAEISLIHHRYREGKGKIKPFWFVSLSERSSRHTSEGELKGSTLILGCGTGIGVAWRPFNRVGLRTQKGVSLRYTRMNRPRDGRDIVRTIFSLALGGARTEAFFSF